MIFMGPFIEQDEFSSIKSDFCLMFGKYRVARFFVERNYNPLETIIDEYWLIVKKKKGNRN